MKFPNRLTAGLSAAVILSLAAGCSPKQTATNAPSEREQELTKTVAELREKLSVAERDLQQARASSPAPTSQTPAPAAPRSAETQAPKEEKKSEDTTYTVVKKTFVPGKLIPAATGANPNATERQAADCRITFKGDQSGKEYPELEVQEIAYASFREGGSYTAQELVQAKKPVAATDGSTAPTPAANGATQPASDSRFIFGN